MGKIQKISGKTSRYVWARCSSRIIALQNFLIRFPHSGAKIRMKWKSPPKTKDSHVPLVRAEYQYCRGLLRRVAAHSNQGRNDWGKGTQFPGRRITMRAPNDCGDLNNVTCAVLQRSTFASERPRVRTRGAKHASCPVAILKGRWVGHGPPRFLFAPHPSFFLISRLSLFGWHTH